MPLFQIRPASPPSAGGTGAIQAVRAGSIFDLRVFADDRPAVLVVSHERSGTHFLMNAVAAGWGYDTDAYLNLDQWPLNINFFDPRTLATALGEFAAQRLASVGKSHHDSPFFAPILDGVLKRYVVFYIHRDPADVMLSYWRLLRGLPWCEGPQSRDAVAFARAEPCGRMLRYQTRQRPTLLHRWAAHVEGWLDLAEARERVVVVRYADLLGAYADTLARFAPLLGGPPRSVVSPSRERNVVQAGAAPVARPVDVEALHAACRDLVGATMLRAGYGLIDSAAPAEASEDLPLSPPTALNGAVAV